MERGLAENRVIDVNSLRCVICIALLAAVTPAAVVLGPIVVGAYVDDLGFSPQQAGYLISAELMGAGLATLIAYFAISRFNWHLILRAALAVCLLLNLISAFQTAHGALIPIRFVYGLSFGTIMTMTIVMVGMTKDQERNFGYWSMGQVAFAVLGFAVFPMFLSNFGVKGVFIFLAAIMALLQLLVSNLPSKGHDEHKRGLSSLSAEAKRIAPIGLIALLFFYIGIGGAWAYVERIGNQAGFDPQFIANVLSGSAIVGVFGAMLAAWMSVRFGRFFPSAFGYLMIGASIALYFGTNATIVFAIASLLFKFAWWFLTPFVLANLTTLDPSGRIAVLTNFVIGFGLGFGPAIAAWLLGPEPTDGSAALDYNRVVYLGVACVVVSFLLLIPVIRFNSSTGGETAAAETI